MPGLAYGFIGVFLLVVENFWRVRVEAPGGCPQLVFLLILYPGISGQSTRGAILAFFFGFSLDSLAGNLPGENAVMYVLAYYAMASGSQVFFPRSLLFSTIFVALLTAVTWIARGLVSIFFLGASESIMGLSAPLLRQVFWNIGGMLVLFPLLSRLEDFRNRAGGRDIFSSRAWS